MFKLVETKVRGRFSDSFLCKLNEWIASGTPSPKNFSPILSGHYHVNQRLNRNIVHTPDFDANTVATVPLVFIAALCEFVRNGVCQQ